MDKKTYEILKSLIDYYKIRQPSISETNEENIRIMKKLYNLENWCKEVSGGYEE